MLKLLPVYLSSLTPKNQRLNGPKQAPLRGPLIAPVLLLKGGVCQHAGQGRQAPESWQSRGGCVHGLLDKNGKRFYLTQIFLCPPHPSCRRSAPSTLNIENPTEPNQHQ